MTFAAALAITGTNPLLRRCLSTPVIRRPTPAVPGHALQVSANGPALEAVLLAVAQGSDGDTQHSGEGNLGQKKLFPEVRRQDGG